MFTALSLLLTAICVSVHAAPLETPEPELQHSITGSPNTNTALSSSREDALYTTISIRSAGGDKLKMWTDAPPPPPPAPPPRSDTLQPSTPNTGASEEDRARITSTTNPGILTSGDSTGAPESESWTEADQHRTESVSAVSSSEEFGTDATMSSEDLPLIFEPFEDVTPAGASVSTTTTTADTEATEPEHTTSDARLSEPPDWQTRGSTFHPTDKTLGDDVTQSLITHQTQTVVHLPAAKPKSDTEDQESREDPDEDEEDEELDSEEEEESEEDQTESTITPHTRPPYSLIPPPPVWVQRNQGLVRSWVELIREKAGYVSGMLAPVGIGIAGALLLVGALYSIRLIHRKRRESFKHQRRKPPREVRSGPDNAMLLADSSEDEF